jgi:fructosamine-3-kinase
MSQAASKSLNRPVQLELSKGGGYSGGGGGASTYALIDTLSQTKYFRKTAVGGYKMLLGEYSGVKEMANTRTIRVPEPVCIDEYPPRRQAFLIFEYLEFCGGGSSYEMGVQLAKVRRPHDTQTHTHHDTTYIYIYIYTHTHTNAHINNRILYEKDRCGRGRLCLFDPLHFLIEFAL